MSQNPYVSTALDQDFNSEQQTRARGNIGAASASDLSALAGSVAAPATANPVMDGTAAVGVSAKYAREDHVHPSDTSKEAVANKTTVVLGTSDSNYPTDKAVAEFVNSSIATNTAHYISDNGDPFTSVAALEAYTGTVTNNDYAFVTGIDSEGNTYYDRYKATDNDSTITWGREYRLNNSSFTAAQWAAINSGITAALVSKIHEHSNKTVLDGITETNVNNWNGKMDKVSGATAGDVATLDANGNIVDSGKTLGTSVPANAEFTDTKVTQTKDDSGTDAYPLLMAGATDPNGTETTTRYDSDVKLNPSTNTITANISGNAATADTASATSSGSIPAGADLNSYNAANRNYLCNADNSSTVTNKPSDAYGAFELEVIRGTGNTCVQVYYSRDNVNFNYIRKCTGLNDGTWTGWVKLIDSDDTVANATTANKLGSANVGLPYMPIYLYGGTPMSIEGYFLRPSEDPSTSNLSADTTLNAVGGRKYVYNVSTSNTFSLTLASTASAPIAFVVRLKCTANCPNVNVTYNDAVEKTTLTRNVYLTSGKMVDMCFTYYYGYFHLVSLVENYS